MALDHGPLFDALEKLYISVNESEDIIKNLSQDYELHQKHIEDLAQRIIALENAEPPTEPTMPAEAIVLGPLQAVTETSDNTVTITFQWATELTAEERQQHLTTLRAAESVYLYNKSGAAG